MIDLIETALNARLASLGTAITGDIAWEGRGYSPKVAVAYTATKTLARRQALGMGPRVSHLWSGNYMLTVTHPTSDGKAPVLRRALAMLNGFPRATVLINGAARVVIESGDMQPAFSAGDWISIPVAIPFFCEELP